MNSAEGLIEPDQHLQTVAVGRSQSAPENAVHHEIEEHQTSHAASVNQNSAQ
jgi:hypothetical protein